MNFKQIKSTYADLPKSVYIIFFSRVVNSIGNFVFPFMTLLLTSKFGMDEEKAGLYLFIASMVQLPGSILGGKLTDIMGRKKIMTGCMSLAAITLIPCAFLIDMKSANLYIPWLLILTGFFNSIAGPASGAMMNDLTFPGNRQAAFSLSYMGMNIGTAVGSIIAGILFSNHMKLLFLGDAATTLLSVILLLKYVNETKPDRDELNMIGNDRADERAETGGLVIVLLRRPLLLVFAVLNTIYSFVYAQTHFTLPLQAEAIFGETLGAKYFGTFNMINCLEVIFLTAFITIATRKLRAIYNVAIAGIFYAVGFGMLFFVQRFWTFALSTIIWTIGEIINSTNVGVYIANHTPISHRGRFNSVINIITGTGSSLSPYFMGRYVMDYGVNNVWPFIFALAASAAVLMYLLGTVEKRKAGRRDNVCNTI